MYRIFFSYNFNDTYIIRKYYQLFKKFANPEWEIIFYERYYHAEVWKTALKDVIRTSDYFILFNGDILGRTQREEIIEFINSRKDLKNLIQVTISRKPAKIDIDSYNPGKTIEFEEKLRESEKLSVFLSFKNLLFRIDNSKIEYHDGLPKEDQIFNYEKDIIDFYNNVWLIASTARIFHSTMLCKGR